MRCSHFEREGLARQEAGKPDPHVEQCADCQAARATYQRMTDALADVGAELYPRAGWEDEVLARVRTPQRPRWWTGAGVAGALLAAAVVLLVLGTRKPAPGDPTIDRVARGSATRGDAWTDGDYIYAAAPARGGAVWVYRAGKLEVACDQASLSPTCVRHGDGVRVLVRAGLGPYHVLAFRKAPAGPAPALYDEAKVTVSRVDGWGVEQAIDVR